MTVSCQRIYGGDSEQKIESSEKVKDFFITVRFFYDFRITDAGGFQTGIGKWRLFVGRI